MIAIKEKDNLTARKSEREFVIHPIFDAPEEKRSGEGLGLMAITPRVRLCLFGLRAYLFVMTCLLGYQLVHQAAMIGHQTIH
jgi:hypothetical protein